MFTEETRPTRALGSDFVHLFAARRGAPTATFGIVPEEQRESIKDFRPETEDFSEYPEGFRPLARMRFAPEDGDYHTIALDGIDLYGPDGSVLTTLRPETPCLEQLDQFSEAWGIKKLGDYLWGVFTPVGKDLLQRYDLLLFMEGLGRGHFDAHGLFQLAPAGV